MSAREPRAAVVAIGDELLLGSQLDLNSSWIAEKLLERGWETERMVVIGDHRAELQELLGDLCARAELVITTGGLGPTLDDVTRESAARAASVPLERSEEVLAALRESYARRGLAMPESNERQAWFPRGSVILSNACGTAPGFRLRIGRAALACIPGPPREMRAMFDGVLGPWIDGELGAGSAAVFQRFYLLGLSESAFADRAGEWMKRDAVPRMGVTAGSGVLSVVLSARGAQREELIHRIERRSREFRERFASHIFSESDARPAFAVGRELIRRGITVAVAESCTGGLVAEMLTRVPGISAVFLEGFITYSNRAKVERLGVDPKLIERCGAVSGEVALAMAREAALKSGARLAVSVTGVAGPGGGTEQKPVGLVWFGLSRDGEIESVQRRFPPVDRETLRLFAAHAALELVWKRMP